MTRPLFPLPTAEVKPDVDLKAVAALVRAEHEAVRKSGAESVAHAIKAGEQLARVRDRLKAEHRWMGWLKEIGLPQQTASNYLIVHQYKDKLPTVGYLGVRGVLEFLRTGKTGEEDEGEKLPDHVTLDEWNEAGQDTRAKLLNAEGEDRFNAQGDNENIEWALWSWNPVTGCLHNCPYCVSGDTLITMADGSVRAICAIRVGDRIMGVEKRGIYWRYVETPVLAHWQTIKPAYRIVLANGVSVICSEDHRWLTDRQKWKYTRNDPVGQKGIRRGQGQRPHLRPGNSLMGYGVAESERLPTDDYKAGYIAATVRGDGTMGVYRDRRRTASNIYSFRLAAIDAEMVDRTERYLADLGVGGVSRFNFRMAAGSETAPAIRGASRSTCEAIGKRIVEKDTDEWRRGFVAGAFDAEGSNNGNGSTSTLRVFNSDGSYLAVIERWLGDHGFTFVYDQDKGGGTRTVRTLRVAGGLPEHLRLFQVANPAVRRKCKLAGCAVKHGTDLRVLSVEPLGFDLPMFDITTGTESFIANGLVSHNCYARDIAERFYDQKFNPSLWPGRLTAPRNTPFPEQKAAQGMGHKNVFVCSMADLFGRWVPREWIEAVLAQVVAAPQWNFLFLTKFPVRMADFDFPENAWVGTTVDCQARVANAEKAFRKVKAGVKWLSCEPLLERLQFADLGAFDWIVLGGASKSRQTPEWKPPREWGTFLTDAALKAGCEVYEKANLLDRRRGYPGRKYEEPTEAPVALQYLPRDKP
jgi:protein gp37